MPFDVNRAERAARTKILACSAADAALLVHGGDKRRIRVIRILMHHVNGSRGTVACAVAAIHAVGIDDAVVGDPHGMADLRRRLLGRRDRTDSPRGTHFGTLRTFGPAVAALVRHFGLHQGHQLAGGAQHLIGARHHTQLTPGTVRRQVAGRQRSRRRDRHSAVRDFLILDQRQSAVHLLLLRLHGSRVGQNAGNREEFAARRVGGPVRGDDTLRL